MCEEHQFLECCKLAYNFDKRREQIVKNQKFWKKSPQSFLARNTQSHIWLPWFEGGSQPHRVTAYVPLRRPFPRPADRSSGTWRCSRRAEGRDSGPHWAGGWLTGTRRTGAPAETPSAAHTARRCAAARQEAESATWAPPRRRRPPPRGSPPPEWSSSENRRQTRPAAMSNWLQYCWLEGCTTVAVLW